MSRKIGLSYSIWALIVFDGYRKLCESFCESNVPAPYLGLGLGLTLTLTLTPHDCVVLWVALAEFN